MHSLRPIGGLLFEADPMTSSSPPSSPRPQRQPPALPTQQSQSGLPQAPAKAEQPTRDGPLQRGFSQASKGHDRPGSQAARPAPTHPNRPASAAASAGQAPLPPQLPSFETQAAPELLAKVSGYLEQKEPVIAVKTLPAALARLKKISPQDASVAAASAPLATMCRPR